MDILYSDYKGGYRGGYEKVTMCLIFICRVAYLLLSITFLSQNYPKSLIACKFTVECFFSFFSFFHKLILLYYKFCMDSLIEPNLLLKLTSLSSYCLEVFSTCPPKTYLVSIFQKCIVSLLSKDMIHIQDNKQQSLETSTRQGSVGDARVQGKGIAMVKK